MRTDDYITPNTAWIAAHHGNRSATVSGRIVDIDTPNFPSLAGDQHRPGGMDPSLDRAGGHHDGQRWSVERLADGEDTTMHEDPRSVQERPTDTAEPAATASLQGKERIQVVWKPVDLTQNRHRQHIGRPRRVSRPICCRSLVCSPSSPRWPARIP